MARYWVGGSATWDDTAGTKWALTSGGAGGQTVPADTDDVFFDAASGAGTVNTDVQVASAHNLNFSGFTGTFDPHLTGVIVAGSLTAGSGMTWTAPSTATTITFTSTASETLTTNNVTIPASFTFSGTGTWTLQDNLIQAYTNANIDTRLQLSSGTFDANGKDVTIGNFLSTGSTTRSLKLGSGTWTLTQKVSGNMWQISSTNMSWNNGGGTVIFAPTRLLPTVTAHPSTGFNFNNLWIKNTYKETLRLGVVVFYTDGYLKIDPGCFINGGSFNLNATLTMKGTATAGYIDISTSQFNTNYAGPVFDCDYLILKTTGASGNNAITNFAFYAGSHSVDNGGNSGWVFADATLLTNNDNTISNPLIPQLVIV